MESLNFTFFPSVNASNVDESDLNKIQNNRLHNSMSLEKLLSIFKTVEKINNYDNRGVLDFLTVYEFIKDNLTNNKSLGIDFAQNILLDRINYIFICAIWYQYSSDKTIFSQAIQLATGVTNSLTKDEVNKLDTLIEELNIVFTEHDNIRYVEEAIEVWKDIINTKLIYSQSSSDIDQFAKIVKVRIWAKPAVVSRLLYFKICNLSKMENVLRQLPYALIKNKNEFIEYKYTVSKESFAYILKSFDYDFNLLELKSYSDFLRNMGYKQSCSKTSIEFLISMLPNYDVIWSRFEFGLHPRKIEKLNTFHKQYIISEDDIIKMICQ